MGGKSNSDQEVFCSDSSILVCMVTKFSLILYWNDSSKIHQFVLDKYVALSSES